MPEPTDSVVLGGGAMTEDLRADIQFSYAVSWESSFNLSRSCKLQARSLMALVVWLLWDARWTLPYLSYRKVYSKLAKL
jgi:hypothetical protein